MKLGLRINWSWLRARADARKQRCRYCNGWIDQPRPVATRFCSPKCEADYAEADAW